MVESLYENIDKFIIKFQVEINENKITQLTETIHMLKIWNSAFKI